MISLPYIHPRWTRIENGVYSWADYEIRREATTHGIRRASNPMWAVYRDDSPRAIHRFSTLREARDYVERVENSRH